MTLAKRELSFCFKISVSVLGTELAKASVSCQKNRPLKDQHSSAPKTSLTSETGGEGGVQHKVERVESRLKI